RIDQTPSVAFESFDNGCAIHVCNYIIYTRIHNILFHVGGKVESSRLPWFRAGDLQRHQPATVFRFAPECRESRQAIRIPRKEDSPVASQVRCQPPACAAIQATTGGPKNWPAAEHCNIQPTVVAMVWLFGATLTAMLNKVPGIMPPTAEKSTTAMKRSTGQSCVRVEKVRKVVPAMVR